MNDVPTSIAGAAVAGFGASFLSSLGIDPAACFWALVGASIGMSFAAESSRGRATVLFVAVVLICSLFGSYLSQRYAEGQALSRNAFAGALAVIFHILLNALVTRGPALVDGFFRKWFGVNGGDQ